MSRLASSLARKCIIEVERKFKPTTASIARLRHSREIGCDLPHLRLQQHRDETFEDVYYDRGDILSSQGIWVRLRSGSWQAKISHGGGFINSQFQELSGAADIEPMLRKQIANVELRADGAFGMSEIARLTTSRQSWRANDRFEVAIDTMDFGHVVGEVELVREVMCVDGGDLDPSQKKKISEELDGEIERFMAVYSWAFPEGKPVGKLSAYFAWKNGQTRLSVA